MGFARCRGTYGGSVVSSASASSSVITLASVVTQLADAVVFAVVFISFLGLAFVPLWGRILKSVHVALFATLVLTMRLMLYARQEILSADIARETQSREGMDSKAVKVER